MAAQVRPFMERLRDAFEETVNFAILDTNRITYVEIVESNRAIRFSARRGDHGCIHSTAIGKAIAATLDESEVMRILNAEGMPKLTPKTIDDPERLLRDLREVRERGYALDDGESEEGARCVAVAVAGFTIPAALSLTAPAPRLRIENVSAIATSLLTIASQLGQELGGTVA